MLNEMIGIEFFYNSFWRYWSSMLYLILYLGCLFYIGKYGARWMKQVFVCPVVILLFTAYNPFVMGIVLGQIDWSERYYRFFWVLPVEILCAYMFAVVIERQKSGGSKAAIILFVTCMVLVCGSGSIKVIPDENIYKMDDYILEISEIISREKTTERPVIICDANVYYQIRQYDPTIIEAVNNTEMTMYRGLDAEIIDMSDQYISNENVVGMFVQGVEVDTESVNALLAERNVEFFVRNADYYSDEYIAGLELSYVGAVEGYEIYRCTQE